MKPYPPVKTTISGEGTVVRHDITRYGLRRLCVMCREKYPDIELWLGVLPKGAEALLYRYVEKKTSGVVSQYLWIYWKE